MNTDLTKASAEKIKTIKQELEQRYATYVKQGLKLDMTRGKPAQDQLDLANGLLELPGHEITKTNSTDLRNYGVLEGLPKVRELFADLFGITANEVITGGNASLTIMHDLVTQARLHGVGSKTPPWEAEVTKFLCPVPGYDRHFSICEHFGIQMIPIAMNSDGPDMKAIEAAVADDPNIKGIWCVPKYSNPGGQTYSDEVVDRLAQMKTAAEDFRIFWDNAYMVHHLGTGPAPLKNILTACKEAKNDDRVYMFASTSKISFAGSGISALGSSIENINRYRSHISKQTIGPDKINQYRHLQFFKNKEGVMKHMDKHAALLSPKFAVIQSIFKEELDGCNIAKWSNPSGGYFVSLDTQPNCARAVVEMAAKAGVKLTQAGATWPYGKDPNDSNIRIAPSLPPLAEVTTAMQVVATCVKLVAIQKQESK